MHRAPAVSFCVVRSRWQLRAIFLIVGLGLAAAVLFVRAQSQSPFQIAVLVCALLLSAGSALWAWLHSPSGQLRWSGQHWYWSAWGDTPCVGVTLLADFQDFVLVSLKGVESRAVYLGLDAPADAALWLALRRALVSAQREGSTAAKPDSADSMGEAV